MKINTEKKILTDTHLLPQAGRFEKACGGPPLWGAPSSHSSLRFREKLHNQSCDVEYMNQRKKTTNYNYNITSDVTDLWYHRVSSRVPFPMKNYIRKVAIPFKEQEKCRNKNQRMKASKYNNNINTHVLDLWYHRISLEVTSRWKITLAKLPFPANNKKMVGGRHPNIITTTNRTYQTYDIIGYHRKI